MTAAIALAVLEAFGPARRAHPGAEARARLYAAQVELAASPARVDPYLVVALIERESGWDPHAVGAKGERGLTQIMPGSDAAAGHGIIALARGPVSIRLGVAWLAHSRRVCRSADPLLFLSIYAGIKKRGGVCVASGYSRGIVARAGVLRALGARVAGQIDAALRLAEED